MAKNKIYCVYCGCQNPIKTEKCSKCHKKLNPKENNFQEYLKSKGKDKIKDTVQDSFLSIVINFIKSHLYGVILTCSVIISSVFVVITEVVNHVDITKVESKPNIVQKIEYAGVGLDSLGVASKYVSAIQNNDKEMIQSLQLKNFYPEIYEELKSLKYVKQYETVFAEFFPILQNELKDNGESFFKNMVGEVYIGDSDLTIKEGKYDDYIFNRYTISMPYCYENTCDDANPYSSYFYITEEIELLLIDGNYYVVGEQPTIFMGYNEQIRYHLFLKYKGDTSKITDEVVGLYMDKCYSNSIEECMYSE